MEGSIRVAEAAEHFGVSRLINFHTALGYGRPTVLPIAIDAPARPFTSYGVSKQAGEDYLLMSKAPVVSLRLANVTGPRLAVGPIPTFYKRLKAGQDCFASRTIRDFVDMEDFLSLMDLVLREGAPTGVFNVSTGTGHSIKEIYDLVVDHLGLEGRAPVREVDPAVDDVPAVVLDPSSTMLTFRWSTRFDFAATIRRVLAWYDEHGVSAVHSHLKTPPDEVAPERAR